MKRAIKILSILFSLFLLISLMPSASALEATPEICFKWEMLPDGTVSITGVKLEEKQNIIIPAMIDGKPVTSINIDNNAFFHYDNLTSITIPDSVTTISGDIFYRSNELSDITVSSENTAFCSIDGVLFSKDRTTLIRFPPNHPEEDYVIPEEVTSIDQGAFFVCDNLACITIPDNVTDINDDLFIYCDKLSCIEVSSENPDYCSIEGVLFSKDKTTLIRFPANHFVEGYVIPWGVNSIGVNAFRLSHLTSITIPKGVTSIGDSAFDCCFDLTDITIPDSVTSIGIHAFNNCDSLTSITIPDRVTSIGVYAFNSCEKLSKIKVSSENPAFRSVHGVLFSKDGATLIKYPSRKRGWEYVIPNGVTHINECAFEGCEKLRTVTIPESVRSIGAYIFGITHDNLSDIYYSGTQSQWNEITIDTDNHPLFSDIIHYNSVRDLFLWILGGILLAASCGVIVWRVILAKKKKSTNSPIEMNE